MSETLARFLFDRQADSYDSDPAMRELAWADADIRRFWDDESQAILEHLGVDTICPTCGVG
jgi:hypothetical protein